MEIDGTLDLSTRPIYNKEIGRGTRKKSEAFKVKEMLSKLIESSIITYIIANLEMLSNPP
jgi:hypothetical protein